MPADDPVTSQTEVDPGARYGNVAFTTTHWTVVLQSQGESDAAQEALEKLCSSYWRPIYSFIRREGTRHEEAEDLTQAFFALLLQRRNFDDVRKEKGRLRSYLLTSLKHFLVSEHRRAVTAKRGKGQQLVRLEELTAGERSEMEPANPLTADRLYERSWALTGDTLYCFAVICAVTGERDLAFQQLEVLAKIPAGTTYGDLRLNPYWDSLRGDPRFEKIVASLAPKVVSK